MKSSYALVALAAMFGAGTANASLLSGNAIFSSFVTNLPDQAANPSFNLTGLPGSPLAQEFSVASPTALSSLSFRLSDAAAGDGGSILVYLVGSNPGGTLPTTVGSTSQLSGTTLLATILDSSLPASGANGCVFGGSTATINACNTTVSVKDFIGTPGNYWIALVNGSDTLNGGTNPNTSGAVWWRSGDNIGLGASTSNTNAHVNSSGALTSQTVPGVPNAFELQVNAPEPASLALLGAGLTGLGVVRRRVSKKSVG